MPIEMTDQQLTTTDVFELKPNYKFRSIILINDNASKIRMSMQKEMKKYVTLPSSSSFELGKDEFTEDNEDSEQTIYFKADTATITVGFIVFEFRKRKTISRQIIEITEPRIVVKGREANPQRKE